MKRVTVIVTDKIIQVNRGSKWSNSQKVGVNKRNVIDALEMNDYHDNCYFPRGSVKVVFIEEVGDSLWLLLQSLSNFLLVEMNITLGKWNCNSIFFQYMFSLFCCIKIHTPIITKITPWPDNEVD